MRRRVLKSLTSRKLSADPVSAHYAMTFAQYLRGATMVSPHAVGLAICCLPVYSNREISWPFEGSNTPIEPLRRIISDSGTANRPAGHFPPEAYLCLHRVRQARDRHPGLLGGAK